MKEIIHFLKSLFIKPTIQDACIGVGNTDNDFLLGSVQNIDAVLEKSKQQDTKITQRNQNNNWRSTMFCTCVAPMSAIASIYNRELTDKEMYSFFLYAKKEYGYQAGVGNMMQKGVDCARNYWNSILAKEGQQVVSFLTQLGTPISEKCLDKGYGLVFCYSGNETYNNDKYDRKLDLIEFGSRTYGHCTMLWKVNGRHWVYDSNKGDWDDKYIIHEGNYPKITEHNRYKEAYVFLPTDSIVAKPKTKLQLYLEKVKLLRLTKQL